jgi:ubiquinone/menaquinone biosynthesis C-methylase UbiE
MTNQDKVKQFAGKILNIYTGSILTKLIDIGYQTGLFEASKGGPATSEELAERAGLQERYVREWLGAMATSGIYSYDQTLKHYTLPQEHAAVLTGETALNQCPNSRIINHFGKHIPQLIDCFKVGGGVPYSKFRPEFTGCMDDSWRRIFDDHLVNGFMGAVEGVCEVLERGIRVLDIGCGTGHATNVLAREYPKSTFIGYDIAEDAIDRANAEAKEMGLTNSTFDVADVTNLAVESKFDLITAFDAVHDQREPGAVLKSVRDALAPTGTFLMIEFKFNSEVHENIGNPFAPLYYGISLMHCVPVSLAYGGPGLGAVWGAQTARRMLAEAGFGDVSIVEAPRPQNSIFVCRY